MFARKLAGLSLCVAGLTMTVGTPVAAQESGCVTAANPGALADRPSPLDSISFAVSGHSVQVCYGRPSARGRTMIGGAAVPFGTLWRTGANEPTMIHTPIALSIAGVEVGPGTYSLYTVPNAQGWEVIVNGSYSQWGHEGQYTADVQAQEIGRGMATVDMAPNHTETFTISYQDQTLVLAWENTRVGIPIAPT